MVLDTFRFTMFVPADADLLPLVRVVSGHLARYLGLSDDQARVPRERLEQLVADRARQLGAAGGPIRVSVERRLAAPTVTVDVTADGPAEASGAAAAHDDADARRQVVWPVPAAG